MNLSLITRTLIFLFYIDFILTGDYFFKSDSSIPVTTSPIPLMACDPKSDSLELVKFYHAMDGPNWKEKWDLTKPMKTWYGINLYPNGGCVWHIILGPTVCHKCDGSEGNNLKGELFNLNLPGLTALILSDNQISGSIPNFDKMPGLSDIMMGGNKLTGTVPNLEAVPELFRLYIDHNQLTGQLPDFNNNSKLIYLHLDFNQLSGPIPEFNNNPKLLGIQFFNNQFSGSLPEFKNCPLLTTIQVYNNRLSGVCPAYEYLKQLTYLELYNNNFYGSLPKFNEFMILLNVPIQNNKYTFSSIIPRINFVNFRPRVTYAPQQKIYSDTTIFVRVNSNYSLDLIIDDTVTTSTYVWYKNGLLYKTIQGSNKLSFVPFTANDEGLYTVKITNPLGPQLTLESWPIRLVAGPQTACDRKADSLELVKFFHAMDGPNWKEKWDLKTPLNTWYGVALNEEGCINILSMGPTICVKCDGTEGNNLRGELYNLNLPQLKTLALTDNQISGNIPNFDHIPILRTLVVGGNKLMGSVPDFNAIPELTHLYINHNQLTGPLPDFGHLPKVIYIYAEHNQISGPIPDFTNLPKLLGIQFFNNQFTGTLPEFRNCPFLATISVFNNRLSGTCPGYEHLKQLTYLELNDNNLSGKLPKMHEFILLRDVLIQNNRYTFGPIISSINFPNFRPRVTYAPQQKIYTDTTIYVPVNSNYTLDLLIDDTVTTSTYLWTKNGVLFKSIKGSNKLEFLPFRNEDAGLYSVKISNPFASQLTLESWPIRLNPSCNSSSVGTLSIDHQMVKSQTPQAFDVLANDNLIPGSIVSILIDKPSNGSIIYSQNTGKGTYTPRQKFSGKELLSYTVCLLDCPSACKSSTIEFSVDIPCPARNNLILPNVIFPTGPTGANKYFYVEALDKCRDIFGPKPTKLMVYNRWGGLVFHTNDYQNNWDGSNTKGDPLPEGTYYYLLDLGSISAPIKGYVAIVR